MNLHLSLQELEDDDWGEPTYHTRVVVESHRLRRVPLKDLTVENLRLLIGQRIGLPYLLPLALDLLAADPLAAGRTYPGDLLEIVLLVRGQFWDSHPALKRRVGEVIHIAQARLHESDIDQDGYIVSSLLSRLESVATWLGDGAGDVK